MDFRLGLNPQVGRSPKKKLAELMGMPFEAVVSEVQTTSAHQIASFDGLFYSTMNAQRDHSVIQMNSSPWSRDPFGFRKITAHPFAFSHQMQTP